MELLRLLMLVAVLSNTNLNGQVCILVASLNIRLIISLTLNIYLNLALTLL